MRWVLVAVSWAAVFANVEVPVAHATSIHSYAQKTAPLLLAAKKKPKKKAKGRPKVVEQEPPPQLPAEPIPPSLPAVVETHSEKLPEPRPLPKGYRAVAILPLVGIDVDNELLQQLEVTLTTEVDEARGLRAITPGDVMNDATKVGLKSDCEGDVTCLARLGRYAGAHSALETRVAALGGIFSISMRMIDTEEARELGRVAEPFPDDPAERATFLHWLAVQLLAPESYIGSLGIQCSQPGADVYLDDKLVGQTPIKKPLKNLRAGPHILRVSKEGFSDVYQFVDVVYKSTKTITIDLSTTTVAGVMLEAEALAGVGSLFVFALEAGLEIRVDGDPKGTTLLKDAIGNIPAGRRRLSFRKTGIDPIVQEVDIQPGQRTDVTLLPGAKGLTASMMQVVLASAPLPTAADVQRHAALGTNSVVARRSWVWPVTVGAGALGAVALLTGSYFGSRVRATTNDAETDAALLAVLQSDGTYSCRQVDQATCEKARDRQTHYNNVGQRNESRQLIALGVGVIALGAGAGLFLWDLMTTGASATAAGPADPPTTETQIGLWPMLNGGGFTLERRF